MHITAGVARKRFNQTALGTPALDFYYSTIESNSAILIKVLNSLFLLLVYSTIY